MIKKIAWRLQADEEGGLPERVRQKALTMADDTNLRVRPTRGIIAQVESAEQATSLPTADARDPRLPPSGTTLLKVYKGQELAVRVRHDSFEFNGEIYPSLSAIANAVNQTRRAVDALSTPTTDKARDADRIESLASLNEQLLRSQRRRCEVEDQRAAAASAEPDRATVLKAISDLETLWDHLTLSERTRMMRLLIERIDHDATESSFSITLSPTGLESFGNSNDEASA